MNDPKVRRQRDPDDISLNSAEVSVGSDPAETPASLHSSHIEPTAGYVPTPSARTDEDLPSQIGPYRILRRIGRGGMGAVFLAVDTRLNREVALKVPFFAADDGPEVLQRFLREARAAAAVSHANVCQVYDAGEAGGIYYMTMAYIDGTSLSEIIKSDPQMLQTKAALIIRKVALAVEEAHQLGMIHRDLKPSNIMIKPDGEPIVTDFGLVRRTGRDQSRLTNTGMVMGTPAYMAPEQLSGEADLQGPACDVYSLGVVLYELLTGHRPFTGDIIAIASKIALEPPPSPAEFRSDVDPMLEAICLKAIEKPPERRFRTMTEFANELGKYLRYKTRQATKQAADERTPQTPRAQPAAPAAARSPALRPDNPLRPPGAAQASWQLWHGIVAAMAAVAMLVVVLAIVNRPSQESAPPVRTPDQLARSSADDATAPTPSSTTNGEANAAPSIPTATQNTPLAPQQKSPATHDVQAAPTSKGPAAKAANRPLLPKINLPSLKDLPMLLAGDAAKKQTAVPGAVAKPSYDPKKNSANPGATNEKNVNYKPTKKAITEASQKLILAKSNLKKGTVEDKLKALDYLRQAIELAPGSEPAKEARKLLDETK